MRRAILAVACALTMSTSTADARLTRTNRHEKPRVLLIGDSQACGASAELNRLSRVYRWDARTNCKVGSHVRQWSSGMGQAVREFDPDLVVIYLGSNDYDDLPDPEPVLNAIAGSDRQCVWVGPPMIRSKPSGLNAHLRTTIEASGRCRYLDSQEAGIILQDGIHAAPNEAARWLRLALARVGLP